MALTVFANPEGGRFIEFVRIDIRAEDDGASPIASGSFEILYTTDGSVPSDTNSSTILRRSPIKRLPLSGPVTLKFFARTVTAPVYTTEVQTEFYDIIELTARNTINTVPISVSNYTLKVSNGDIVRTEPGFYELVYGQNKTIQDIKEIILVEDVPKGKFDGNRMLPGFGSELNRMLGSSFPVGFMVSSIKISIYRALTNLIAFQKASKAPSDEQIRRVVSISVVPQTQGDATKYSYNFIVETVSGETATGSGSIVGG